MRWWIGLAAMAVGACGGAAPEPQAPDLARLRAVDAADPETCVSCHETVVSEWRESMHSRSHHASDPIYAAVRTIRMGREGEAVAEACVRCHSPLAEGGELDGALAQRGVTCAACHGEIAATHPAEPTALGVPDGAEVCLTCHDSLNNAAGLAMCNTGPEHAAHPSEKCSDCHMPLVQTPSGAESERASHRAHTFSGPHRAWLQDDPSFLSTALTLAGRIEGSALTVDVTNASGHAFPTGFPGRMAALLVVAKDASGAELWRNLGADPVATAPEAVWHQVWVDAEGKPVLAPYGVELKRDTRLQPGEARQLSYPVPEGTASVELTVMYRLAPPPLMETLGLADAPEAQPKVVARVTVSPAG